MICAAGGIGYTMSEQPIAAFYDEFSTKLVRDWVYGNKRVEAQLERVIVVGCGCGEVADFLARRVARRGRILAIDISPANIRIARLLFPHKRIEYRCVDILAGAIPGPWNAVVLPDLYEHIPAEGRDRLHGNLRHMLGSSGRVLLTLPSPWHQAMLRDRGCGLQIVDETVALSDLTAMADDLGALLTYFSMVSVFRTNDYIHAVIEQGADRCRSINPLDRVRLKRSPGRLGLFVRRRFGQVGRLARAWRRWRVGRLLGPGALQDAGERRTPSQSAIEEAQ